MGQSKVSRNDRCPCGSLLKYKHCCGKVVQQAPAPPAISQVAAARVMEAYGLYEAGQLDQAEAICLQLLAMSSRLADPIHLVGMVQAKRGNHVEALESFDKAISLSANDTMHSNKGLSLQHLGRIEEAEVAFKASIRLNPRSPMVRSNYGLLLMNAGRHAEASAQFEEAIRLAPSMAAVHGNLALCRVGLADFVGAESSAMRAVELNPRDFNGHSALSTVHMLRFNFKKALEHFELARTIEPNSVILLDNYFRNLIQTNQTDDAKQILREIYAKTKALGSKVQELLSIPVIYESSEEIDLWRERFRQGLEALKALEPAGPDTDILTLYSSTVFYLAFHGMNDVDLMRGMGDALKHLVPVIDHSSPYLQEIRARVGPRRVGFFSRNVHDHPVTHSFSALFEHISQQEGIEAFLISPSGFGLADRDGTYRNFKGVRVPCPPGLSEARRLVEELKLDLIVYTDIGMDPLSYFLACGRLAPVQCSVPGHPVTTGIGNMDHYFSLSGLEPRGAQAHYSENLILTEPFAKFPELPAVEAAADPQRFGLPADARFYMCPVMLQKMHPEFDEAMAEILRLDPQGLLVLFETQQMPWKDSVLERLSRRLSSAELERVRFMPYIRNRADFVAALKMAHVVIDPFHFGLGSTTAFIVAAEVPFVTWPGETMRGRIGLWLSDLLELPEAVVEHKADFPSRAVAIARDAEMRVAVENRMRQNRHRLFESIDGIRQVHAHVCDLIDRARARASALEGAEVQV